ncbi:hypothetical protein PCE1_003544 [Barthelona sp. PCE]
MQIQSTNYTFNYTPCDEDKKPAVLPYQDLGFGAARTSSMVMVEYDNGEWKTPSIVPYGPISLDPCAKCLHYSQTIFEGAKAFNSQKGNGFRLFRLEENAKRFNQSATRMAMPEVPIDLFMESAIELIKIDKQYIPTGPETSLYIRPFMIGSSPALGVKPSDQYIFCIVLSPCGPYFKGGFTPVPITVATSQSRASPGGTGEAKTGGNYAATLQRGLRAKNAGYSQVLWLDALEHRYITEVGAMNIMFVEQDGDRRILRTPKLDGTILHGITRKSVLQIAREIMHIEVVEEPLDIEEIVQKIRDEKIVEIFGTGTAAVISPVNKLEYKGEEFEVKYPVGETTQQIFSTLTGMQYGNEGVEDIFGWVTEVEA